MTWKVADVMTPDVVTVHPETSFKDCVEMIGIHRVGALPVADADGRLIGIITESDLLRKEELKGGPADWKGTARVAAEAMTRGVVTVGPETAVGAAARLMHRASVRHLPVVAEGGRLVGIVARADLLKVFLRSDESIRREVEEELLPEAFHVPAGSLEVDVRDGVVHLIGSVESERLLHLLPAFVERVDGVVGVVSRLRAAAAVPD